jgi:hypothetical protein
MDLTFIYIIVGIAIVFTVLAFGGWLLISYLVGSLTDLNEDQKEQCMLEIENGGPKTLMCKYYVKHGFCPSGNCDVKKEKIK